VTISQTLLFFHNKEAVPIFRVQLVGFRQGAVGGPTVTIAKSPLATPPRWLKLSSECFGRSSHHLSSYQGRSQRTMQGPWANSGGIWECYPMIVILILFWYLICLFFSNMVELRERVLRLDTTPKQRKIIRMIFEFTEWEWNGNMLGQFYLELEHFNLKQFMYQLNFVGILTGVRRPKIVSKTLPFSSAWRMWWNSWNEVGAVSWTRVEVGRVQWKQRNHHLNHPQLSESPTQM